VIGSWAWASAVARFPVSRAIETSAHQHVAIRGMELVRLLQQRHCVGVRAGRVQRDGIGVSIARVVGHQLVGPTQQIQCFGIIALTYHV
jgi:hypothetical protein